MPKVLESGTGAAFVFGARRSPVRRNHLSAAASHHGNIPTTSEVGWTIFGLPPMVRVVVRPSEQRPLDTVTEYANIFPKNVCSAAVWSVEGHTLRFQWSLHRFRRNWAYSFECQNLVGKRALLYRGNSSLDRSCV